MSQKSETKNWLIFSLLLILSLSLRLYRLNMSLWMDEIITVTEFIQKPWLKIITYLPYPNNHILYTLFAKLSVFIFGEKEWSIRLPAMLIGALIPPVSYLVLRKKFSEPVAFASGIFLSLNYWSVWFGQDARGYSAYILFSLLSSYLLLEYLEKREKRLAFYYLISAVIGSWFYLYTLFIIFSQLCWTGAMLAKKQIKPKMLFPIIIAGILGISLYLPSLTSLWDYSTNQKAMARMHPVNVLLLKETLIILTGSRKEVLIILFLVLALLGFYLLYQKSPGFLFIYLLSALFIVLFSKLTKLFIYPRFLAFLIPLFSLAISQGLESLTRFLKLKRKFSQNLLYSLLVLSLSLLLLPDLARYYLLGKQDFKSAGKYLEEHQANQQIICYGIICEELSYYFKGEMILVNEKEELSPEFIRGKFIISRWVDWTEYNFKIAQGHCITEKTWRSAGYKENILLLFYCP